MNWWENWKMIYNSNFTFCTYTHYDDIPHTAFYMGDRCVGAFNIRRNWIEKL